MTEKINNMEEIKEKRQDRLVQLTCAIIASMHDFHEIKRNYGHQSNQIEREVVRIADSVLTEIEKI